MVPHEVPTRKKHKLRTGICGRMGIFRAKAFAEAYTRSVRRSAVSRSTWLLCGPRGALLFAVLFHCVFLLFLQPTETADNGDEDAGEGGSGSQDPSARRPDDSPGAPRMPAHGNDLITLLPPAMYTSLSEWEERGAKSISAETQSVETRNASGPSPPHVPRTPRCRQPGYRDSVPHSSHQKSSARKRRASPEVPPEKRQPPASAEAGGFAFGAQQASGNGDDGCDEQGRIPAPSLPGSSPQEDRGTIPTGGDAPSPPTSCHVLSPSTAPSTSASVRPVDPCGSFPHSTQASKTSPPAAGPGALSTTGLSASPSVIVLSGKPALPSSAVVFPGPGTGAHTPLVLPAETVPTQPRPNLRLLAPARRPRFDPEAPLRSTLPRLSGRAHGEGGPDSPRFYTADDQRGGGRMQPAAAAGGSSGSHSEDLLLTTGAGSKKQTLRERECVGPRFFKQSGLPVLHRPATNVSLTAQAAANQTPATAVTLIVSDSEGDVGEGTSQGVLGSRWAIKEDAAFGAGERTGGTGGGHAGASPDETGAQPHTRTPAESRRRRSRFRTLSMREPVAYATEALRTVLSALGAYRREQETTLRSALKALELMCYPVDNVRRLELDVQKHLSFLRRWTEMADAEEREEQSQTSGRDPPASSDSPSDSVHLTLARTRRRFGFLRSESASSVPRTSTATFTPRPPPLSASRSCVRVLLSPPGAFQASAASSSAHASVAPVWRPFSRHLSSTAAASASKAHGPDRSCSSTHSSSASRGTFQPSADSSSVHASSYDFSPPPSSQYPHHATIQPSGRAPSGWSSAGVPASSSSSASFAGSPAQHTQQAGALPRNTSSSCQMPPASSATPVPARGARDRPHRSAESHLDKTTSQENGAGTASTPGSPAGADFGVQLVVSESSGWTVPDPDTGQHKPAGLHLLPPAAGAAAASTAPSWPVHGSRSALLQPQRSTGPAGPPATQPSSGLHPSTSHLYETPAYDPLGAYDPWTLAGPSYSCSRSTRAYAAGYSPTQRDSWYTRPRPPPDAVQPIPYYAAGHPTPPSGFTCPGGGGAEARSASTGGTCEWTDEASSRRLPGSAAPHLPSEVRAAHISMGHTSGIGPWDSGDWTAFQPVRSTFPAAHQFDHGGPHVPDPFSSQQRPVGAPDEGQLPGLTERARDALLPHLQASSGFPAAQSSAAGIPDAQETFRSDARPSGTSQPTLHPAVGRSAAYSGFHHPGGGSLEAHRATTGDTREDGEEAAAGRLPNDAAPHLFSDAWAAYALLGPAPLGGPQNGTDGAAFHPVRITHSAAQQSDLGGPSRSKTSTPQQRVDGEQREGRNPGAAELPRDASPPRQQAALGLPSAQSSEAGTSNTEEPPQGDAASSGAA